MSIDAVTAGRRKRKLTRSASCAGRGRLGLERVDVELDVVRERVSGRQILRLDQRDAAGTVELHDPAPLWIGRETILALDDRRVYLARVALGDQTAALVVLARAPEVVTAAVAGPALRLGIEVEVLGDPALRYRSSSLRTALPKRSILQVTPGGTR